jgi:hypothetical protein
MAPRPAPAAPAPLQLHPVDWEVTLDNSKVAHICVDGKGYAAITTDAYLILDWIAHAHAVIEFYRAEASVEGSR